MLPRYNIAPTKLHLAIQLYTAPKVLHSNETAALRSSRVLYLGMLLYPAPTVLHPSGTVVDDTPSERRITERRITERRIIER